MKKIILVSLLILCSTCFIWAQDVDTSKEIKIGLLMSFQLQEQLIDDTNSVVEPAILNSVLPSLQFYEGALMAANRLNNIKAKFVILDLGKDSTSAVNVLQQTIKDTCDVYFAIVPSNCNFSLMKFIKRCKRPVISLNSIPQALMKVNPGLWLATPSNLTQLKQFSSYLFLNDTNANYIVLHREEKKEEQLVNFIFSNLDSISSKSSRILKVNFKLAKWDGLKTKLSAKNENYIIVPTNDESFLTNIVEQLGANKGNYKITLCGLPSWEGFESISPLELTGLNTTIFNGYYIDYNLPSVKEFRQDYIDEYHADPIANSFIGFDLVNNISQNIDSVKVDSELFQNSILSVSGQPFFFERSNSGGCMENKFFNILRYDTDRFLKLNK